MKILTNENNEPKIYVQIKDILYLKENEIKMPNSISKKIDETIINDNSLSYIGFNDEAEIDFFINQDYIIDINEYKDLSLEEIEEKANSLVTLINKMTSKYNCLNIDDKEINSDIKEMYNHIKYKFDSLAYIYSLKKNKITPSFVKGDEVKTLKRKSIKS